MKKPVLILLWILTVVVIFLFMLCTADTKVMNISSIGYLLMGIGMTGRGLMMLKQRQKSWPVYLSIGVILLVTLLFGLI